MEKSKTIREKCQKAERPYAAGCAVLISALDSPKDHVCERRLTCEASCLLALERRVVGQEAHEGKRTKCKFDRQKISFLGSGVLKICLQDGAPVDGERFPALILQCSRVRPMITMCAFKILKTKLISIPVH